jgi:SAM-dependent methyltransferase
MHDEWLENLRRAYDAKADERDHGVLAPWKAEERLGFLKALRAEGAQRLLEIGSGPGRDGLFFQDHEISVTCVDLSPRMVALCREKGLEAYEMDLMHLAFPPQSFDAAYALNSLLHVPADELLDVLRSIRRLLRLGGLFYLGVYGGVDLEGPFGADAYEPPRFFCFHSDDWMRKAVAEVFELISFRVVETGEEGGFHFQSMILRKASEESGAA